MRPKKMLIRYLVFCLGCGMLQSAWERTPLPWQHEAVFDVPYHFLKPGMFVAVQILSFLTVPTELVIGFSLFRWWGLVIWLPSLFVAGLIFPGKNPGPCFFVGVLISALGLLLLATA